MIDTLTDAFRQYSAYSFDKQLHLAELVGDLSWHFNMSTGLLSFGSRFHWQSRVLGTESESSGTWLWAWANDASNIPDNLFQASVKMKAFGEEHQISELTEPDVPLGEIDGHSLALIASGVCQANAYYRGPFDGGAVFLLIMDENFPCNTESPLSPRPTH